MGRGGAFDHGAINMELFIAPCLFIAPWFDQLVVRFGYMPILLDTVYMVSGDN